MNYSDLDGFSGDIEKIEDFFTEFASKEEEILTYGMRIVVKWESYAKVSDLLKSFETLAHEFLKFLRPIDKALHERVLSLINSAHLVESIAAIEVSLRVATQKQKLGVTAEIRNTILFHLPYISNVLRKKKLFSEDVIPIQRLLITLARLKNFVSIAKDTYISQWSHDSDVFKPSNLDHEKIIALIEKAIENIGHNSPISNGDKKQLIEYLNKAKSEFSEDRPSWNRIVGALVIAAAITGGIADSSGAMKNIDDAIKYILGTSVEKHVPSPVPLLNQKDSHRVGSDGPEVIDV